MAQEFFPEGYTSLTAAYQKELFKGFAVQTEAKSVLINDQKLYTASMDLTGGVPLGKNIVTLGGKIGLILNGTNPATGQAEAFKPVFAINLSKGF